MNRYPESWLTEVNVAARLQACEIELQCTKEELRKRESELVQCKNELIFRESQVKTHIQKQKDIEKIHKELVEEYEKQVLSMKDEIMKMKQTQETIRHEYVTSQAKHASEPKENSTMPTLKIIKTLENIEALLMHSYTIELSNEGDNSTAKPSLEELLTEQCCCFEMDLRKHLSSGDCGNARLTALQGDVNNLATVVQNASKQLQKTLCKLRAIQSSGQEPLENVQIQTEKGLDSEKFQPPLDTKQHLELQAPIASIYRANLVSEATGHADQIKSKINTHLCTLESLVEDVLVKQVVRNVLAKQ